MLLRDSVVALEDNGSRFCTAFKIDARKYMTAGHCIRAVDESTRVVFYTDRGTKEFGLVSYVSKGVAGTKLRPLSKAKNNDWGLVHTTSVNENVKPLVLGCLYKPQIGDGVAYMGYPANLEQTFSTGYVSSVNPVTPDYSSADFAVDVQAAPGASGSPVIVKETGNVIGILIEGVYNNRNDFYMVGIQAIRNTALCDDFKPDLKIGTERTDVQ